MNIEDYIKKGLLENFESSYKRIRDVYEKGNSRLNFAKVNLNKNTPKDFYEAIYTAIYDAARIIGESFLLLNGYRAKIKDHHKTIIFVSTILMKDYEEMPIVLKRLNRMRKTRNKLDYDFDASMLSFSQLKRAFKDVQIFAKNVEKSIKNSDKQYSIL